MTGSDDSENGHSHTVALQQLAQSDSQRRKQVWGVH